ncbi:MAG: hypothetical protein KDA24_16345 [Deltaproteobacteria bacterium]|nr:hypothetical protein [Deltaproteobacteria bacterium]
MRRLLLLALPALLLIGCGDLSRSTGELGRLDYSLHSDFLVDGTALVGTSILTGHPQVIDLALTDAGEDAGSNFEEMSHVATPSAGVTLQGFNSDDDVGNLTITVTDPGDYVIESMLDGSVFDRITLTFDSPTTLDLVTWVRVPNGEEFDEAAGGAVSVVEGAQAAFVPIPLDADNERIAGDFVPELSASPDWAVVAGINVLGIYEQNVVVARSPASVYFIEPGMVTLTLTDPANAVDSSVTFDVDPVEVPVGR